MSNKFVTSEHLLFIVFVIGLPTDFCLEMRQFRFVFVKFTEISFFLCDSVNNQILRRASGGSG